MSLSAGEIEVKRCPRGAPICSSVCRDWRPGFVCGYDIQLERQWEDLRAMRAEDQARERQRRRSEPPASGPRDAGKGSAPPG